LGSIEATMASRSENSWTWLHRKKDRGQQEQQHEQQQEQQQQEQQRKT
jgi:hypothetical protein